MGSSLSRRRAERESYIASLFSASTLAHKTKKLVAKADLAEAQTILGRLDAMPTDARTDEQRDSLVLDAKLRALYLSGGNLEALERAVGVAMVDHRDLQTITESPVRYERHWPGTAHSPRTAPQGPAAFDEYVEWLAK